MSAAKRNLDAEDRFEMLAKGETSATNPGAQSGSIAGKDRGPLHRSQVVSRGVTSPHIGTINVPGVLESRATREGAGGSTRAHPNRL